MRTYSEIKELACQARSDFEANKVPHSLLMRLYSLYNPSVGEIELFLNRAVGLFPALNCGVASLYLQHVLSAGDIINGKYIGQRHTFLALGSLVIDITADQFGGPPVYVGPLRNPWTL